GDAGAPFHRGQQARFVERVEFETRAGLEPEWDNLEREVPTRRARVARERQECGGDGARRVRPLHRRRLDAEQDEGRREWRTDVVHRDLGEVAWYLSAGIGPRRKR